MLSQESGHLLDNLLANMLTESGVRVPKVDIPDEELLLHEYLMMLGALTALSKEIDRRSDTTARAALRKGASFSDVGRAAQVSKQRSHQRWGGTSESSNAGSGASRKVAMKTTRKRTD
jgi:hypothetical protein